MKHVHSWRRFKGSKFYCTGISCYQKVELALLQGKLVECPQCQEHFLLDISKVSDDVGSLTCLSCNGAETDLTLEKQRKILSSIVEAEIKETYMSRLTTLINREKYVEKRDKELRQREIDINKLKIDLEERERKLAVKEKRRQALVIKYRKSLTAKRAQIERQILAYHNMTGVRSKKDLEMENQKLESKILDALKGELGI